ncbi:uncharacterized protein LOC130692482 isoform X2 [Daphnia carinata]|uniref:uncharacterized protein LOC130692482 isoform X2 n=1 Tax=Daphnia carinata TaxID=120202 RepID=UPI002868EB4F|nr:uncharacterized protein LOC130692482 isoform X2 [Daphnia carinata]
MASRKELLAVITVFSNFFFVSPFSLPHVNPGLFVIQGVSTCGHGDGYCLLSNSCLVDTDFEGDIEGGHCDGLKHAFNPHADFVCCKYMPAPTTLTPTTVKTKPPPPPPSDDNTSYNLLVIRGGVSTCGNGGGFCLLSDSCSIVQNFESDTEGGHCSGLKDEVNPQADFVCCKYLDPTTAASTTPSPPAEESVSYNELEIQGGVSTCGHGGGFCLLSGSCEFVPGFQSDTKGGHCEGVFKANPNSRANFVCCKYVPLSKIHNPTTSKNAKVNLPATTTPPSPPVLTSVTSAQRQTGSFPEKVGTSTTRTSETAVDAKKNLSPFSIFANTNKILSGIQHLIYGGRMRPSAAMQKYEQDIEVASNDKSMVSLILMGLKLNETTARSDLIN